MTEIIFIYQGADYYLRRETICRSLIEAVATMIDLPKQVQLKFGILSESTYGLTALENRFKNRIVLNTTLPVNEIPSVLVHELIHLSQSHLGRLRVTHDGSYYWDDKSFRTKDLSYEEYQRLPWEVDVEARHQALFTAALQYVLDGNSNP
jgi:hypothetical protein